MRRGSAIAALAAAAGAAFLVRRRRASPRDRVDLYLADGSVVSLRDDESEQLLSLARDALRSAHA